MQTSHSLRNPHVLVIVAMFATSIACAGRPVSRAAESEALNVETTRISQALDRLEERLLASQGAISMWDELRDRHEDVSAVACSNLSEHAGAMAMLANAKRDKRQSTKNRLASRTVVSGSASR